MNLDPKLHLCMNFSADWSSASRRSASASCTTSTAAPTTFTATGRFSSTTTSTADITFRICTKGLSSVLDYKQYTIENEDRYCLQSSPMVSSDEDAATGATRKGDRAWYFWQYPNLMINCYEGYMDTNYVIPVDADHCTVIFDFYFSDVSEARREYNDRVRDGRRTGAG